MVGRKADWWAIGNVKGDDDDVNVNVNVDDGHGEGEGEGVGEGVATLAATERNNGLEILPVNPAQPGPLGTSRDVWYPSCRVPSG